MQRKSRQKGPALRGIRLQRRCSMDSPSNREDLLRVKHLCKTGPPLRPEISVAAVTAQDSPSKFDIQHRAAGPSPESIQMYCSTAGATEVSPQPNANFPMPGQVAGRRSSKTPFRLGRRILADGYPGSDCRPLTSCPGRRRSQSGEASLAGRHAMPSRPVARM